MPVRPPDPLALAYHELRAPLALIVTAAQAAASEDDAEAVRRRLASIERAAMRLLRSSGEALRLEELSLGPAPADRYCPVAVVAPLVNDMATLGMPVRFEAEEAARTLTCAGNAGTLEALVQVLLGNALDHACPDSMTTVSLGKGEGEAVLSVANERPGFVRHRGLGLSTYLASRLATGLGARLSTAVDGDEFRVTVRIPLVREAAEPPRRRRSDDRAKLSAVR